MLQSINLTLITFRLTFFALKNPRLQHIFNEELDDLEKSFADIKKMYDPRLFKYEVLLSFWLAVHMQKLEFTKLLYGEDIIVENVVRNMFGEG